MLVLLEDLFDYRLHISDIDLFTSPDQFLRVSIFGVLWLDVLYLKKKKENGGSELN